MPATSRADILVRQTAQETPWARVTSFAYLKLQISEKFRKEKDKWHTDPEHHGTVEIPPPPPMKCCIDQAKNPIDRTAAQIRTRHWRTVVYVKRIKKQGG